MDGRNQQPGARAGQRTCPPCRHRRRWHFRSRRDRAFTLIEIAAVVLILAIAAGAVALRSHAMLDRTRMQDTAECIEHYDGRSRALARRHDRALRLVVDLGEGTFRRTDERAGQDLGEPLVLGDEIRIVRVWVAGRRVYSGTVSIACSRHGLSPSYAVCLEDRSGRRRWLLVAGLSGRVVELEREQEAEDVFAAMARQARRGTDAG